MSTETQQPIHQPGVFNIESFDGQRWHGGMNRRQREDAIIAAKQWSATSGARYRVFSPDGELVFDSETQRADLLATLEAFESGIPDVDLADYREARAAVVELFEHRNALEAEVHRLRESFAELRQLFEGFEVSTDRLPLQAPAAYLVEVRLTCEFQPGVGERMAQNLRTALARIGGAA